MPRLDGGNNSTSKGTKAAQFGKQVQSQSSISVEDVECQASTVQSKKRKHGKGQIAATTINNGVEQQARNQRAKRFEMHLQHSAGGNVSY